MILIVARVDRERLHVEWCHHIALSIEIECREWSRSRWIAEILFHKSVMAALYTCCIDLIFHGLRQCNNWFLIPNKSRCGSLVEAGSICPGHDRVVIESSLDVVNRSIVLAKHRGSNVSNVDSGVALSGKVNVLTGKMKKFHKILAEFHECRCSIVVVQRSDWPAVETCTNWTFNPGLISEDFFSQRGERYSYLRTKSRWQSYARRRRLV